MKPRSACPECGRTIPGLENIPVVSYLAQRGRCRGCGLPISLRYPVVELLVAAAWGLTAWRIGLRPVLPAFLAFVTALVILSAIDLEVRRLPNKIIGPGSLVGMVLLGGAALAEGRLSLLKGAALGVLAYGIPMLALALAVPAGMGMGDVKFAGYIGAHVGSISLPHVAVAAFTGFFFGAVAGVSLILFGKKGRGETIPFGPSMAAGAVVAVWYGHPILRAWLG